MFATFCNFFATFCNFPGRPPNNQKTNKIDPKQSKKGGGPGRAGAEGPWGPGPGVCGPGAWGPPLFWFIFDYVLIILFIFWLFFDFLSDFSFDFIIYLIFYLIYLLVFLKIFKNPLYPRRGVSRSRPSCGERPPDKSPEI